MKPILAVTAVLIAAAVLAGCSPEPDEADSDSAAAEESTSPDGSRERSFRLSCGGDYQHRLEDAWYDVAGMHRNCVRFQLRSETRSGDCVFSMPRSQSDKEAIQKVIHSWTRSITSRSVGSVAFWGTLPVHFDNCELFSNEGKRRSDEARRRQQQRQREQSRCASLEAAVDSTWRRWADHSSYESRVEDERLYAQYRAARDAWDNSGCI